MPVFGTQTTPVRSIADPAYAVYAPEAYGDTWWTGLHWQWMDKIPPGVTRATAIIVNPLCRMPWLVDRPDGTTLAPGDRGYPVWIRDPQLLSGSSGGPWDSAFDALDRQDRFNFWSRWITSALWLGAGVLAYVPDGSGQPLAGKLQLVEPTRLYKSEEGWAVDVDGAIRDVDGQGDIEGSVYRLRLLRHSLPAGVFGRHRAQMDLANRITAYADETLNSDVPSGTLNSDMPLNQTQADQARKEWRDRQRNRQIAVLGNGVKYNQVLVSPVDAEIAAMGQLSNVQIAHMFEQPAWMLDAAQPSTTYTNAGDWRQDLVDGPLSSWSARLEGVLSALLPWGWRVRIDFTSYTTPTTTEGGGSGAAVPVPGTT